MGRRAPTNLHPLLKGPYQGLNHNDRNECVLQNLVTDKLKKNSPYPSTSFWVFRDPCKTREVAQHDTYDFVVEWIVDHRGDISHMSDMEYVVKWWGYNDF